MQPVKRLEKYSVQEFEDKNSLGYSTIWSWDYDVQTGTILPEWGLHSRDRVLRELYRNHYNWIGQAAVAALTRKIKQVPYSIQAGRNNASYYQEIFNKAQFNRGWGDFLSRFLLDFLTCDYGGYFELIGRGKADSPIKGRVMGISALDSLRCIPTGNNEYPVIYYSKITGQLHRLHESRVVRLVDMPDGDESRHLAGLCAMSRAAAMVEQQIPLQKYVAESMDEKPPIGIFYNNAGMTEEQWENAVRSWKMQRDRGQAGIIALQGDSQNQNSGQFLRFADAPEGFDYNVYIEIAVNAFAAAFGIDRQDIWPLTGKMAGTATQSEVLFEKARGMAFGDILSTIERALNNFVLPKDVEFSFEYKDEEKDKQVAEKDTIILGNALELSNLGIPKEQVVRYLANNSEQFNDILTDDKGEIIELPDDDMKPDPIPPQLIQVETPQLPGGQDPEQVQVGDNTEETEADDPKRDNKDIGLKKREQPRDSLGRFGSGGGGGGSSGGGSESDSGGGSSSSRKPKKGKPSWAKDPKRNAKVDKDGYLDLGNIDHNQNVNNYTGRDNASAISSKHVSNLGPKHKEAVQTYAGEDYQDINGGLRGQSELSEHHQNTIDNIDAAMEKNRLERKRVLYRSMVASPELREQLKPGAEFSDPAYTSASFDQYNNNRFGAAAKDDIDFRIKANEGQKGIAASELSNYPEEAEFILPRGTKYRITDVHIDPDNGRTYVDAEIVSDS